MQAVPKQFAGSHAVAVAVLHLGTWRDLGGKHAGVVVDVARVDQHPLGQLGDLLVEAGHQAGQRLRRRHSPSLDDTVEVLASQEQVSAAGCRS